MICKDCNTNNRSGRVHCSKCSGSLFNKENEHKGILYSIM